MYLSLSNHIHTNTLANLRTVIYMVGFGVLVALLDCGEGKIGVLRGRPEPHVNPGLFDVTGSHSVRVGVEAR